MKLKLFILVAIIFGSINLNADWVPTGIPCTPKEHIPRNIRQKLKEHGLGSGDFPDYMCKEGTPTIYVYKK